MIVEIEINSCKQCPHFKVVNTSTTDGFDHGEDWKCMKADKMIAEFVEWHEKDKILIPEWCPIKVKC